MEAVVILIVPLVALIIGAVAYFQPRSVNAVEERTRLEHHIAWLEERLAHAQKGNWDEQMMSHLNSQLEEARRAQRALAPA